jgi:hypothetical protein
MFVSRVRPVRLIVIANVGHTLQFATYRLTFRPLHRLGLIVIADL